MTIHIAMCTDQGAIRLVPTVVRSVVEHSSRPVRLHLLHRAVEEDCLSQVVEVCRTLGAEPAAIAVDTHQWGTLRLLGHTTVATMDRILLPDLLPDVSRVVYLDTDVVVNADLCRLWEEETGPRGLAAKASFLPQLATVLQQLKAWNPSAPARLQAAIDPRWPSFNAGVLLMDLDTLRRCSFATLTRQLVHEYGINDQLALGIYAQGAFRALEPAWNVYVGQDHEQYPTPKAIHWVGPRKPWLSRDVPLIDYWDRYWVTL